MQTAAQQPRKQRSLTSGQKQPPVALESLVYEVLDGRPLYYRGYEDVLSGKKSPEEIMGSSSLQWVLASYDYNDSSVGCNEILVCF